MVSVFLLSLIMQFGQFPNYSKANIHTDNAVRQIPKYQSALSKDKRSKIQKRTYYLKAN